MKDSATLAVIKFLHDLNNFIEVEEDLPGGGRVASLDLGDDDGDDEREIMFGDRYDPVPESILEKLRAVHHAVSLTLPLLKVADEYMDFKINDNVFVNRWNEISDSVDELQTEINHESAAPVVQRLLDQYHGDDTQ